MDTREEMLQSQASVLRVTSGQLTPNQVEQFLSFIDRRRRLLDTQVLEQRVRAIEQLLNSTRNDAA